MGGFLVKILGWLFGALFNKSPPPSQEAVQAKEAGAAETEVAVEAQSNAKVQTTANAGDDVVRAISTDDGLRNYEQSDPNNRG